VAAADFQVTGLGEKDGGEVTWFGIVGRFCRGSRLEGFAKFAAKRF
jgi:hypothetical protein